MYTVIEDGRWSTGGKSIDHIVESSLRKAAIEQGYELLGASVYKYITYHI